VSSFVEKSPELILDPDQLFVLVLGVLLIAAVLVFFFGPRS
jgi:hypothetical protein